MEAKKGMFGNGQTTCKICQKPLTDKRKIELQIKHTDGTQLAKLEYFAPLCPAHRGEGALAIGIEWGDVVPLDETLS